MRGMGTGFSASFTSDSVSSTSKTRSAEASELEVHRLEERIEALELALADPAMYDGTGDAARRAGQLDRELTESRRALDQALTSWTEAVESLGQPARSE